MDKVIEEAKKYYKNDINCYNAFLHGVEWCEDNLMTDSSISISNHKSPWISVKDDMPCNHSDLVLTYKGTPFSTKRILVMTDIHTLFLCEMKKDDDQGWIWNISTKDKIIYWMSIPELPNRR